VYNERWSAVARNTVARRDFNVAACVPGGSVTPQPAPTSATARRPTACPAGRTHPGGRPTIALRRWAGGVATGFACTVALLASSAPAQVILPPDLGRAGGSTRPSVNYDLALAALGEGRTTAALELATAEYGSATRTGTQRWIDSIAAAAVVGECHYELGNFPAAIAAYEEALLLSAVHANWLLSVQFGTAAPRPLERPRVNAWGRSARNVVPANVPETIAIRQGTADPQQVLRQGGVLSALSDRLIRPQEIVRGLVISLYRHGDLLGGLAHDSTALDGAARTLARRPAPPNHFSQSWIDVAWGTALWAQGKPQQARPLLERGLVLDGRFDHPLAAWALIVLGRIALDSDRPDDAARFFEEATYTAADFGDARALEEAFRWTFAARMATGGRGVPAAIAKAAPWAAQAGPVLAVLAARLQAWQAESLAVGGDLRGAAAALERINTDLLSGDPGRGNLGAETAYARAVGSYAVGKVPQADAELGTAIGLARSRSPRLFQTTRLVQLLVGGSSEIPDRRAEELFAQLLGPPSGRDFAVDPLGTLAVLATPQPDACEAWVRVAFRRGPDAALDACETAARQRWQASQPLGGRRIGAERLLDASPATLAPERAALRAALLAPRPDLAAAIERMRQLRGELGAAALAAAAAAPDGPPQPAGDAATWSTFTELGIVRTRHVAALAAGREPVTPDFPPVEATREIRRRLQPGQLILSFFWTSGGLTGVLESKDRAALWEVRQAAGLGREIDLLTRALGLFDAAAPVSTDKLQAGDWAGSVARIERMLFENSQVTLAEGIDELIIVPDGWLWYVPFELLPVATAAGAGQPRLLRDVCRVRYCPTRSLAVSTFERQRPGGPIGVYAGRMNRGDAPAAAVQTVADLATLVDRAVPLPLVADGPPAPLVAGMCDALAIFEEIPASGPVASRRMIGGGGGSRLAMTFADWLGPPLKRPGIVVLPGMQTAMSGSFGKNPAAGRPGDELFFAATDLLAAGAHTAVLARWRVGGQTAIDLVGEFLHDATAIPDEDADAVAASESWRRAVDLVTAEWPDPLLEPRLKQHPEAVLGPGSHPFLWAGYLLVDCGPGRHAPPPPPPALRAAAAPLAPAPPALAREPVAAQPPVAPGPGAAR
jgi:tetratricopeptide (TPR) repeat protein